MITLKLPRASLDWGFGLNWVLATTVGWLLGFALCEGLKAMMGSIPTIVIANTPCNGSVDGALVGLCVGAAQWLAIRRRLHSARWWILACVIGFSAGKAISDRLSWTVPGPVAYAVGGAAIGLLVGTPLSFLLRRQVAMARWWAPACVLGWVVGWLIISFAEAAEGGSTAAPYVIGAAGAALAGLITGSYLLWTRLQQLTK